MNYLLSLIKLIIYIYKTSNSASNWFKINILIFNNLKSALNIIYYLFNLYQILRLNYYKYFKVYTKCKLSLFIENIVNEICLIILIKIPWLI